VLIPLPLRKPKLVSHPNHQYLRALLVKYYGAADRLVYCYLLPNFARVETDRGRSVLGKFSYKLVTLFLPIAELSQAEHIVYIEVKSLFDLIRKSIGVLDFLTGEVDNKLYQEILK
jgi:hypothetical protein